MVPTVVLLEEIEDVIARAVLERAVLERAKEVVCSALRGPHVAINPLMSHASPFYSAG